MDYSYIYNFWSPYQLRKMIRELKPIWIRSLRVIEILWNSGLSKQINLK